MPAEVPMGTEKLKQNGYVEVKTPQGWRFKHHLVAEKLLGRPLKANERVKCLTREARANPTPENIEVVEQRGSARTLDALDKRLAAIELEVGSIRSQLDKARGIES